VIPDAKEEKTTTDVPNSTTSAGEVSGVVPDAAKEETTPGIVSEAWMVVSRIFINQE